MTGDGVDPRWSRAVLAVGALAVLLDVSEAVAAHLLADRPATDVGYAPDDAASTLLRVYMGIGDWGLLVWLVALVLTAMWLQRLRDHAEAVAPDVAHRRAWGWALFGWVTPVVSWWFPYQLVDDLVTALRARRPPLGWWWAAWLADSSLTWLLVQERDRGDVPRSLDVLATGEAVQAAACAVAFALWTLVVVRLQRAADATRLVAAVGSDSVRV